MVREALNFNMQTHADTFIHCTSLRF